MAIIMFCLVRWMSKGQYAQFAVTFGFQSTIGMLTDLGVSGCIIALCGEHAHDPAVVGRYVTAARDLRARMFWIVAVGAIITFPLVTLHQHWGIYDKLFLLGSVLVYLYFEGWMMYQAPLVINGQMKRFYLPQTGAHLGRLIVNYLLHILGLISGITTVWVNAIAASLIAYLFRRAGSKMIQAPAKSDPETRREMLRYLAPLMPGIIYTAFQGQISLFLITYFGNASSIADVAALGRLGQLFILLGAFNGVIVEPVFAKLPADQLRRRYPQALVAAVLLASLLVSLAALFRHPLLWVLGGHYAHLHRELVWMIAASSIAYVAGVLWTINSARQWLFWWYTGLYIFLTAGTQVVCALVLRMDHTHDVIMLNLCANAAGLFAHLCGGIYGLLYAPHRRNDSAARPT